MAIRWVVSALLLVAALAAAVPLLQRLSAHAPQVPTADPARPETPVNDRDEEVREILVPHTATVYRWRDDNGTVHYESRPPPDGVPFEVLELRGERRVTVEPTARAPAPTGPERVLDSPFSVYSPEGMDELMDTLDSTLETLGDRRRTLRELEKDL